MKGEEPRYCAAAQSVLGGVSPRNAVQAASLPPKKKFQKKAIILLTSLCPLYFLFLIF